MSEIKGQLLGIILVLSIFLTVSVAVGTIFATMTNSVEEKVTEVVEFDNGETQQGQGS